MHKFKSEKENVLTIKVNKISLSGNDDKTIQSIDSIEAYAHGTSKVIICKNRRS